AYAKPHAASRHSVRRRASLVHPLTSSRVACDLRARSAAKLSSENERVRVRVACKRSTANPHGCTRRRSPIALLGSGSLTLRLRRETVMGNSAERAVDDRQLHHELQVLNEARLKPVLA